MAKYDNVVIIVAAGRGTRMRGSENKQFIKINGKPMLYYSLKACDDASFIDYVIVVAARGEEQRIRDEIIDRYKIKKVRRIVPGGHERYDSVYEGLRAIDTPCGYVFIHDGARPCVTPTILSDAYSAVQAYDACVVGVRERDTIRRVYEGSDILQEIMDRNEIWHVQTPQAFSYRVICEAYLKYTQHNYSGATDDATIVEQMLRHPVHMVEGSPRNIKVTTPEDLAIAEVYLQAGR